MKYKGSKVLGKIIRYLICAVTIDVINVTDSFILSYLIISPLISKILWLLSRYTCKKIVYQMLNINESSAGSWGYTISYCIYVIMLFIILIILKKIGIIPFANDFDIKFINCIAEYLNNRLMSFNNKIIEILITTTI